MSGEPGRGQAIGPLRRIRADPSVDAYLEAWLHHAAKRRMRKSSLERLEQLERQLHRCWAPGRAFLHPGVNRFWIESVLHCFGAGFESSAEPLVSDVAGVASGALGVGLAGRAGTRRGCLVDLGLIG